MPSKKHKQTAECYWDYIHLERTGISTIFVGFLSTYRECMRDYNRLQSMDSAGSNPAAALAQAQ
ncbi:MAG: hypothetical protein U0264_09095 [Candidatus Kapaibacterium sp.]